MLVAGDEMGRTQGGNNNAYCQDNPTSWIDWSLRDEPGWRSLFDLTARLMRLRRAHPVLRRKAFFSGRPHGPDGLRDVAWFGALGTEMADADWFTPGATLAMFLSGSDIPDGTRAANPSPTTVSCASCTPATPRRPSRCPACPGPPATRSWWTPPWRSRPHRPAPNCPPAPAWCCPRAPHWSCAPPPHEACRPAAAGTSRRAGTLPVRPISDLPGWFGQLTMPAAPAARSHCGNSSVNRS